MRPTPVGRAGCCTCATACPAPPPSASGRSGSAPGGPCRAGTRSLIVPDRTACGREATAATSCCSPTPSPPGSSRTTRAPRSRSSRRRATGCTCPRRPIGDRLCCGRTFLAAAGRRGAARDAGNARGTAAPSSSAACPWSAWSPPACSPCATSSRRCCPAARPTRSPAHALLLEEFLWREHAAGRLRLPLRANGTRRALVHGHCHQKAFGAMAAVTGCLGLVPGLEAEDDRVELLRHGGRVRLRGRAPCDRRCRWPSSRCLPAVRAAAADTLIVADGTSCRQQIRDGSGREASTRRGSWPMLSLTGRRPGRLDGREAEDRVSNGEIASGTPSRRARGARCRRGYADRRGRHELPRSRSAMAADAKPSTRRGSWPMRHR